MTFMQNGRMLESVWWVIFVGTNPKSLFVVSDRATVHGGPGVLLSIPSSW